MDEKKFMKRFFLWTAIAVAAVMLVLGLCFGRVIEESLFAEIAKWVLMTAGVIGIFWVFAYTLGQFVYHGSRWDPDSEKYKKLHSEDKK